MTKRHAICIFLTMVFPIVLTFIITKEIYQPDPCCAYPNNKSFGEQIAVWSGPIAIFVAIIIAVCTWYGEKIKLKVFRQTACENIIAELAQTIKTVEAESELLGNPGIQSSPLYTIGANPYIPSRPYFDGVRGRMPELPDAFCKAIIEMEGIFQMHVKDIENAHSNKQKRLNALRAYLLVARLYHQKLKKAFKP